MSWEAPLARDLGLKNASVQRKLVLRKLSDAANLLTSITAGQRTTRPARCCSSS
jgi:hypothetical protein